MLATLLDILTYMSVPVLAAVVTIAIFRLAERFGHEDP